MDNAPTELEVKFFPIDIVAMRKKLSHAGATLHVAERLMRRCMFSQELNSRMASTYIRVRDEGNKVTLSAKQHATNDTIGSQKEYETTVGNFETTRQILLAAGLRQSGYQENKRETWRMPDGTLVELETWPQLPHYLEIEGKSLEALQSTAAALNLQWGDHIIKANDYLYGLHYGIDRAAVYKKISYLTFES